MQCLTPLALARLAHPHHVWARFHLNVQSMLLRLLTGSLRLPDGRVCRRLMLNCPPQHGKSTIVSQLFPPICFAQNPAAKVILLSYSSELAEGHAQFARAHIEEFGEQLNPALALDPHQRARNHWKTTAGGHMIAASLMGTVAGRAADIVIVDDYAKGPEDAGSAVMREKCFQTFKTCAETRLSPEGIIVIVATRWNADDLCGRLLESEADDWHVISYPAFAEEGDALGRAPGETLFPERYSLERYESTRRGYEIHGISHLYDCLFQCKPTGDMALRAFSDPKYFEGHIWCEGIPETPPKAGTPHYRVLALDPSKSKTGKTGDYAGWADLTLYQGHVFANMTLSREPLPALYERALVMIRQAIDEGRPFDRMVVEVNMFQQAVAIAIRDKLSALGINLHIEEWNTSSKDEKNARIVNTLSPLLAQKRIHFVGQSIGNKLTKKQLEEIPNGAHDDGPDALEQGISCINRMLGAARAKPSGLLLRV